MLGLAVLESGNLIDYSVKLFKEAWTPAKMDRILTSLTSAILDYNTTHMVLSIPPIHFQEKPFNELWQEITVMGRDKGLVVESYKQRDLQALCGHEEMMSRRLLMNVVVERFPELEAYRRRELSSRNKYYYKMFEAVAVALLYENDESE